MLFVIFWAPMEEHLGMKQVRIGTRVAASNLKMETMGKVAVLCDGVAKYPCSVSYDLGWQKASRMYDSLSGQGLMIGHQTKWVVACHNYSKACLVCKRHLKVMQKNKTPDLPVCQHLCPRNHEGSSKGMEARAALECVNKVWGSTEIRSFIEVICIDDNASTRAYLKHSFEDLDALGLPRPATKTDKPKNPRKTTRGSWDVATQPRTVD
jgi:hypothetical protein